jgi:amino acid transporter
MLSTPSLKRAISLPLLTLYGLGTTIGAGIFVLIGKIAGVSGVYAPFAFLLASLLAGLSAFSFAELSSRYPESAGEAVYVREGLGSRTLALIVGLFVVTAGLVYLSSSYSVCWSVRESAYPSLSRLSSPLQKSPCS